MEDLLNNHLESLRRKRGALAWAFFPEDNAHAISDEAASNLGSRYLVCAACHPNGLPVTAAASLCGGKQTGVFRYHWKTGQRSITDHVNKKHEDLVAELRAAKARHVAVHGDVGLGVDPTGDGGASPDGGVLREPDASLPGGGVRGEMETTRTKPKSQTTGERGAVRGAGEGGPAGGSGGADADALPGSAARKKPRLGAGGGGGDPASRPPGVPTLSLPGSPVMLPGSVPTLIRLPGRVPAGLPRQTFSQGGAREGVGSGLASSAAAAAPNGVAVEPVPVPVPVSAAAAAAAGEGAGVTRDDAHEGAGPLATAAAPAAARHRRLKGGHQPAIIDLRSDTVTKPTEAMRRAMAEAAVGDDVFGDDPTVKQLELEMAATFAKEAALFVPSGTMGNLVAVGVHCEVRGSEFICGNLSHIHVYEQGGLATLMGAHPRQIVNKNDGTMDLEDVRAAVRVDDQHFPTTRVLCIEQTHNKCGGRVLPLEYVDRCGELAREQHIKLHVDGARIWNAAAALGVSPARCVAAADSVSVCLSKGLGAPVGSVILGTRDFIAKCRRLRKACGGTMRQAGVLAAAALMAVKEVLPVLHLDHARMNELAAGLGKIEGIKVQRPVQSNICFVNFAKEIPVHDVVAELAKYNVIVIPWVGNSIRMVTHHEINQAAVSAVVRALQTIVKGGLEAHERSGKGATEAAAGAEGGADKGSE